MTELRFGEVKYFDQDPKTHKEESQELHPIYHCLLFYTIPSLGISLI